MRTTILIANYKQCQGRKQQDNFIFYFQDGFRRLLNIFRGSETEEALIINATIWAKRKLHLKQKTIRKGNRVWVDWDGQGRAPLPN